MATGSAYFDLAKILYPFILFLTTTALFIQAGDWQQEYTSCNPLWTFSKTLYQRATRRRTSVWLRTHLWCCQIFSKHSPSFFFAAPICLYINSMCNLTVNNSFNVPKLKTKWCLGKEKDLLSWCKAGYTWRFISLEVYSTELVRVLWHP